MIMNTFENYSNEPYSLIIRADAGFAPRILKRSDRTIMHLNYILIW